MIEPTRREFVHASAMGLAVGMLGCAKPAPESGARPPSKTQAPPVHEAYARAPKTAGGPAGGYGAATAKDIEGPFYRANAPFRTHLAAKGEPGPRLRVRGRVVRGAACVPLAGAVLDIWQADKEGHYDNDDPNRPPAPGAFHLRGRVRTDAKGQYEVETIWPGRYAIGPNRWRPAHLHLKVSAPGSKLLTTQLYFEGDPHNAKDPWFDAARMLRPKQAKDGVWVATYEVVLA